MKAKKSNNLILARMDDEEDLFSNLEEIAKKYDLKSGIIICALGMLKDVELAYLTYPRETGKYLFKQFSGPFEVVSLKGNLGYFENKLVSHIHVALADKDFNCLGGHLNKAKINATLELFILIPKEKFMRKFDEKTGLKVLHFE
jgi:hypothetical protein